MRRINQSIGAIAAFLAVFLFMASWTAPAYSGDQNAVYTLQADGLACPFCAYGIEKQLSTIEGVKSVDTEIKSGTVIVTMHDGASLDEAVAKEAVDAAGFTLREFKREGAAE